MRKGLCIALAVSLMIGLTACSGTSKSKDSDDGSKKAIKLEFYQTKSFLYNIKCNRG